MSKNLLKVFYDQVMFFSNNGTELIESPNIMVSEIHKITGQKREKVIELFVALKKIDFLEEVPETQLCEVCNFVAV
ncbi:hypothetical protein ACWGOQ_0012630 [Aquimarina sp. M1]